MIAGESSVKYGGEDVPTMLATVIMPTFVKEFTHVAETTGKAHATLVADVHELVSQPNALYKVDGVKL